MSNFLHRRNKVPPPKLGSIQNLANLFLGGDFIREIWIRVSEVLLYTV